jgi:hypothetical protein
LFLPELGPGNLPRHGAYAFIFCISCNGGHAVFLQKNVAGKVPPGTGAAYGCPSTASFALPAQHDAGDSADALTKAGAMSLDVFRTIGLTGVAIILVAYFANQRRWLSSEDWRFPAANLVGSLLIMVSLYAEWNLPSVVVELCWIAISVYGLVNRLRVG